MDRFPPLIFIYKVFLLSIVPYKGGLKKKEKKKLESMFFSSEIFDQNAKNYKEEYYITIFLFFKNLLNFFKNISPHLDFFFIW